MNFANDFNNPLQSEREQQEKLKIQGNEAFKATHYDEALKLYETALALDPTHKKIKSPFSM